MSTLGADAVQPLTQERRRAQTREHLLRAAARVFAERGFHGASLDEVAADAGFTKGAVYSNFKNKEDLFLALLEARQEQEMEALRSTLESSEVPPESRMSDFAALVRDEYEEDGAGGDWGSLYQEFFLYAVHNRAVRERLALFDEMMVDSVAQLIEEGRRRQHFHPPEPARHVARIIIALFRGIGMMRTLDPEVVDEPLLETAMSFLAHGLVPPG